MADPGEAEVAGADGGVETGALPSGPRQVGRGIKGRYVYWITFSQRGTDASADASTHTDTLNTYTHAYTHVRTSTQRLSH